MLTTYRTLLKRTSLPLVAAIALATGAVAQESEPVKSAGEISVSVSGSPVEFGGGKPMMQGESVLVPFRAVLEKLGSTVQYDAATKRIDATTSRHSVQLTPGSTSARVNDRDITMTVAPEVVAGTLYIPLRFVSESLGATVQYDAAGKTVAIQPAPQDTTETQTMNEANSAGNDMNSGTNGGDMNPANNAGNMAENSGDNAAQNDSVGMDSAGVANDANATNNASRTTAPATTSTVAPTPNESVSTEPSFFQQYMWPILGVLAALILATLAYLALKGRRSGQVIASSNDKNTR